MPSVRTASRSSSAQPMARPGPSKMARTPSPVIFTKRPRYCSTTLRAIVSWLRSTSFQRRSPIAAACRVESTKSVYSTAARTRSGSTTERAPVMILTLFAAAIGLAGLVTHVAMEAEYKLIYLLAFGVAPLVAIAWNFWKRTLLTRGIFVLALAICFPTNALTSFCFAIKPPHESRDPSRLRLLSWIREQTLPNSICVEYPWWEKYQTSDSAFLYLDRYYFDIAVYGNRRQLIGYGAPMLEQWGYRDIGLRQELARKLVKGEPLTPADVSYLTRLRAPIIVVTDVSVVGSEEFDSTTYVQVYADGNLRAYRVVLAES